MNDISEPFETYIEDLAPLGQKRGPLLCQLPPSLAFDIRTLDNAFKTMRATGKGQIVIEARHKSWTSQEAVDLLTTHKIDRVFADPALVWPAEAFDEPPRYVPPHGKPKIYYSAYSTMRSDLL
ncbi:DUF72 domain-containing protein [Agrobacterium sp. NPDC089420]|uniref:DUF72 domain-containing protein n=1 Tax=Agrobacterium sp. NPDC089420 TaxID=3363918 RepID=UPI00384BD03F